MRFKQRLSAGWVLAGCLGMSLPTLAQDRATPEHAADEAPGTSPDSTPDSVLPYLEVLKNYDSQSVRGFTVWVHRELAVNEPDLLEHVLLLLEHDLAVIEEIVPASAFAILQQVPIWIERQGAVVEGGMSGRGMCFHASTEWVTEHGLLAEKTGSVEIVRAADFPVWRRSQPFMTFHELSHAYHHLLGVDDAPIRAAFAAAQASGRYDAVARNSATEPVRAYAMTNHIEYFAELSEALFGLNDFYPYSRRQLAQHDPEGLAAVQALWNLPADEIAARVAATDFMGQLEIYRAANRDADLSHDE